MKKKSCVTCVYTRDGIIHCILDNKHITVSNPDALFKFQLDQYLYQLLHVYTEEISKSLKSLKNNKAASAFDNI